MLGDFGAMGLGVMASLPHGVDQGGSWRGSRTIMAWIKDDHGVDQGRSWRHGLMASWRYGLMACEETVHDRLDDRLCATIHRKKSVARVCAAIHRKKKVSHACVQRFIEKRWKSVARVLCSEVLKAIPSGEWSHTPSAFTWGGLRTYCPGFRPRGSQKHGKLLAQMAVTPPRSHLPKKKGVLDTPVCPKAT